MSITNSMSLPTVPQNPELGDGLPNFSVRFRGIVQNHLPPAGTGLDAASFSRKDSVVTPLARGDRNNKSFSSLKAEGGWASDDDPLPSASRADNSEHHRTLMPDRPEEALPQNHRAVRTYCPFECSIL